jgi:hypothetical protein
MPREIADVDAVAHKPTQGDQAVEIAFDVGSVLKVSNEISSNK